MTHSDPSQNLSSIGEGLKTKREAMGLSLMDVSEVTKVSVKHLGALERDAYKELPSEIYAWLFLRTYAKHLGFKTDEIKRRYNEIMHPAPAPATPVAGMPEGTRLSETPDRPTRRGKGPPDPYEYGAPIPRGGKGPQDLRVDGAPAPVREPLRPLRPFPRHPEEAESGGRPRVMMWGLLAAGGILVMALAMWKPGEDKGFQASGAPPATVTATLGAGASPVASTLGSSPAAKPPVREGVLRIKANMDTWVDVLVDGTDQFALRMRPGDEKSWLGRKNFLLQVGYPPGLEIMMNGTRLTLESQRGEPLRDVEVYPDGRVEYHRTPFE